MADIVNVQNAPGVPALNFAPNFPVPALIGADTPGIFQGLLVPQWGIYLGGAPVVSADTVVSFEYKKEYVLSDYPVEDGAFASYDKVELPYDVRVRYVAGGSEANRASLLASIQSIVSDLNLYQVVTPEAVYLNANARHYDYRRTAINGVGLLAVEVWCEEVRLTNGLVATGPTAPGSATTSAAGSASASASASASLSGVQGGAVPFQSTASPTAAAQVNIGTVQASPYSDLSGIGAAFPTFPGGNWIGTIPGS